MVNIVLTKKDAQRLKALLYNGICNKSNHISKKDEKFYLRICEMIDFDPEKIFSLENLKNIGPFIV